MLGVGIVGCGNISGIYASNLGGNVAGVADIDPSRAEALAGKHGFRAYRSVEELLASPEIGLVLNLTTPGGHVPVCEAALLADKHVYVEKPLALSVAEGEHLLELAEARGLTVCSAPDTVLGSAVQTCRRLLDDGKVGEVVTGFASMLCPGHEGWHPDPGFYYRPGGGPLWDMGPYYLTALVWLLGPVASVTASASSPRELRTIGSGPHAGETVPVETPTTIVSTLEFVSGAVVQFMASFDVPAHGLPHIELHGGAGAMRVPDPNGFGGTPQVWNHGGWQSVPLDQGLSENSRGIGVVEALRAVSEGREPRCSGRLGLHVVEVMEGALASTETGIRQSVRSHPGRLEPFTGGSW